MPHCMKSNVTAHICNNKLVIDKQRGGASVFFKFELCVFSMKMISQAEREDQESIQSRPTCYLMGK